MLGLKFEDHCSLDKVESMAATPGIAFAEWAPGDMGMSFGDPDAHDPPYSPEMAHALQVVRGACQKAGIAFYPGSWNDPSMAEADRVRFLIRDVGATIMRAPSQAFAQAGRALTGRTMAA
jgi:4-hydroxy-2-oxoheptanedioate aldolase